MPSSRSNSQCRFCCASKQPLQLVGQARHHRRHRRQLLVEKIAQPRQFLGVAQIGSGNLFVELGGIDFVAPVFLMRERLFLAVGLQPVIGLQRVGHVFGLFRAGFDIGVFAVFAVLVGFLGLAVFALLLGFLVGAFILVVGILAVLIAVARRNRFPRPAPDD